MNKMVESIFLNSKISQLLQEYGALNNKIKYKLDNSELNTTIGLIIGEIFLLASLICFLNNKSQFTFVGNCLGIVSIITIVTSIIFSNKWYKKYYEKKAGLIYKKDEIVEQLKLVEVQKVIIEYFNNLDPSCKKLVEKFKLLILEGNYEESLIQMKKIMKEVETIEENKKELKKFKELEEIKKKRIENLENSIGVSNNKAMNNHELEYEADLKKIL